jgi:hypothetical protein
MCFYYDEQCDVYREEMRRARKPHKCEHCRRPISKGEQYVYAHGIFDAHTFDTKSCGSCELDRWRIHLTEIGEGCSWSESWADMSDPDLSEWIESHEFERSTAGEGQRYLAYRQRRDAEKCCK